MVVHAGAMNHPQQTMPPRASANGFPHRKLDREGSGRHDNKTQLLRSSSGGFSGAGKPHVLLYLFCICYYAAWMTFSFVFRKWRQTRTWKPFKGSTNICFDTTYWTSCGCACEKWLYYLRNPTCNKL